MKKLCVILSLILVTEIGVAADCQKCLEAVKAGEEYISLLEAAAVTQGSIISKLEQRNELLVHDLNELEARQNAWYNSPFLLLGLGALLGVAVSK